LFVIIVCRIEFGVGLMMILVFDAVDVSNGRTWIPSFAQQNFGMN
jgi:hypothetical protein